MHSTDQPVTIPTVSFRRGAAPGAALGRKDVQQKHGAAAARKEPGTRQGRTGVFVTGAGGVGQGLDTGKGQQQGCLKSLDAQVTPEKHHQTVIE